MNPSPYPKNPTICKFMIQIGRYEELGSGVRRVNKYLPHYAPGSGKPVFEDGDTFTVTVPITAAVAQKGEVEAQDGAQVEAQVKAQVEVPVEVPVDLSDTEESILQLLRKSPLGRAALLAELGYSKRTGNFVKATRRLLSLGLLEYTIPDKPTSRLQKYRLTDKGRAILARRGKAVK